MVRFRFTPALGLAVAVLSAGAARAHDPASGAPQPPAALSAAAAEASATVDAFHAALTRGETQAALALLTDDALVFEAGGAERSRAEYAAEHLAADAAFSAAVQTRTTRRTGVASGPFAWIASEGRAAGRYKDRSVDQFTAETMLLRKVGRDWRIAHIHWSSRAATP